MKKYLFAFSVLLVVLAIVVFSIQSQLEQWQTTLCWVIIGYFSLITIISHLGLENSFRQRPQAFVRYYMASTSLRLLLHLVVIIAFSALNRPHATFFIVAFMIAYFVFMIFEVGWVMKRKK